MEINVKLNKSKWKIVTVYSRNMVETLDYLETKIKEEEKDLLLLGGNFNVRTASEGGLIGVREKKEEAKRRSEDRVINKEGRVLLNGIKERG